MILDGSLGVVLVPGFMADATLWRDVEADLSVVGPMIHGDLGKEATLDGMARRIVEESPARFLLVGFSMGGYVAREVARLVPERVAALVLIATSARPDSPAQVERNAAASGTLFAPNFAGLSRAAIASSLHPERDDDESHIERIREMGVRLGHKVFQRQSRLDRGDDRGRLREIGCPTLVIAAAQDRLRTREEASELRQLIPGAALRVIEESGHMIPIEQPRKLAETIVEWLRGVPG
ncbi:Pimeloyl-ACP methyl ester carboxylesterase [Verrucomicrobium sp. GAS474]|uniref:alpha/beta fold hydrolase n=1 Tax=Verrucomicrobium sp. GAS474 TaxID=1882831 RepID=UPI00087A5FB1|nr:alpha/beta hydrolase [Verrucomicrobium sp. GAS474]SDT95649.1 Pimeloyl-ACP methyl ester carboxylesterase [Verrucomicrobium sp. GAS474]